MVKQKRVRKLNKIVYSLVTALIITSCGGDDGANNFRSSGKYNYRYSSNYDSTYYDLTLALLLPKVIKYNTFNFEMEMMGSDSTVVRDTFSIPVRPIKTNSRKANEVIMSNLLLNKGIYNFKLSSLMPTENGGILDVKLRMIPKE